MIRAVYLKNGDSSSATDVAKIKDIIESKPNLIWIDIIIENNDFSSEELSLLTDVFKFHELSIEDCLIPQYHPKIEEFENYAFVALHGIKTRVKDFSDFEETIYELDIFIGKTYIVTVHTSEVLHIESLYQKAKLKPLVELKNLENLLYSIFQKIVASYEFNIQKISETVDMIEDKVLENPSQELISNILDLKKELLNLRKIGEAQRNVYGFFTREINPFISKKSIAYFREILFQFERLSQTIASYNQIISSILEVYVSSVTLKLNEVIKFLTVIATIFLPALLITSYYGMNVVPFPEHKLFGDDLVWYFAFSLILVSTLLIYIYLKRKKWL
ncbi:MAG: magnesium transporter CorA family protein [Elusimicrobia bacterium]|nr:magnesium transporter CorA family protein [Candidatus Liberimonas magnetica]